MGQIQDIGLVWQAREAHKKSQEHNTYADHFRKERDRLIRELYETGEYSYSRLAAQVGCSNELIAKIIQGRR